MNISKAESKCPRTEDVNNLAEITLLEEDEHIFEWRKTEYISSIRCSLKIGGVTE